jgi:hypothetical protein
MISDSNPREWRLLGVVFRLNAMPAPLLAGMLTQKLMDSRIENADLKQVPLDCDEVSNPAGRHAIVGRFDSMQPSRCTTRSPYLIAPLRRFGEGKGSLG